VPFVPGFALPPEPAQPDPLAFSGLAGRLVKAIEPYSEADPIALLVQILVAFGSCIGRSAHFVVESSQHYFNMFAVLVGQSSKARKGSSWSRVRNLFSSIDSQWLERCVKGGLASGEGLIWSVRDPIQKKEPMRERGQVTGYQEIESDPGVSDKRLLFLEPEFASILKHMDRLGSILSTQIRQAWDEGDLRTVTKTSPAQATGAHISLVGHITLTEATRYLSATEQASGFANRFMWLFVKRSKLLPNGAKVPDEILSPLIDELRAAVRGARQDRGRNAF
jgi:hypothetical protein